MALDSSVLILYYARMDKYKMFPSLRIYDQLEVPYVLTGEQWEGPLWTGHCMMLATPNGFGDEAFLHELGHWVEASPKQRMMPDFALGKWVNGKDMLFATSTSPHLHEEGQSSVFGSRARYRRNKDRNTGWGEPTVSLKTATGQEERACLVMYLYHALVGNTSWDKPVIATAAYDFAGVEPFSPSSVTKRTTKIVKAMTSGQVSPTTVRAYCDGLKEIEG